MRLAPENPVQKNLLCVANFPSNTGFAWDFIEALFSGLADRLQENGVRTWVAYPKLVGFPETLRGSNAQPLEQGLDLGSPASMHKFARTIRGLGIGMVYLCDRPSWHPAYSLLRMVGVTTLVVHDHTSGARTIPRGWKRLLRRARQVLPGTTPDWHLAVSDYVARRKVEVDLVSRQKVRRIWNSVVIPPPPRSEDRKGLIERFELPGDATIIACASRATPEKGICNLLRAFDTVCGQVRPPQQSPVLLYLGDGPQFTELQAVREKLTHRDRVFLPGFVRGASPFLGAADLAVVPSVWNEAFGLSVLEPMSFGVPVVATQVGGIPEIARHGQEGLLIPPGDEAALAKALLNLIQDPPMRRRLGARGRARAIEYFSRENQLDQLSEVFSTIV